MASTINDILLAVIGMAQATQPYAAITIGALPAGEGITMTYGPGGPDTTFWNKGVKYSLPVVLNAKSANQQTVADALNNIHLALAQTRSYPRTGAYQITNISTIAAPAYLDREENGQWLYGSSLRVDVYIKKQEG